MAKQINKQPHNWSDEELVSWGLRQVEPGNGVTDEKIAEEIFKRADQDQGTVEQARGIMVEVAPVDENGDGDGEELDLSQEAPEGEAVPEPAVKEAPVEAKKEAAPAPQAVKTPIDDEGVEIVDEQLQEYMSRMYPGRSHQGNEGATLQVKLYRTIQMVLRMEGRRFISAFKLLLNTVNDNRDTVFHERYAYRYFDSLTLTNPERRNFERILNLLMTTCDPKTRSKAVQQVDVDLTMEGFRNPEMHQRVVEFYQGV